MRRTDPPADPPVDAPGTAFIAHCRAGFEPEAARDLERMAEAAHVASTIVATVGCGYAIARTGRALDLRRAAAYLRDTGPVFVRSAFLAKGPFPIADAAKTGARPDRIVPLVAAAGSLRAATPFSALWIEHPDTNEGKRLSPLARALHARLAGALRERELLDEAGAGAGASRPRLHVMLLDGATAWLGVSDPTSGSPWPMGIPRLHLPRGAPSRSTLKLAEACLTFLGDQETELLHAGMHAVDLGAAPGGWSWQLAQRGLRILAVDNGNLQGAIAEDAHVTHVREDGLRFRPRKPVDWVTCDIVESPSRIAALMGAWIAEGTARQAIFNLKLPMKKRYDEIERCRDIITAMLDRAGLRPRLALRQLYHDREEVTGYLARR